MLHLLLILHHHSAGDSPCAGELNLAMWVAVVMTLLIAAIFVFICARQSAFRYIVIELKY